MILHPRHQGAWNVVIRFLLAASFHNIIAVAMAQRLEPTVPLPRKRRRPALDERERGRPRRDAGPLDVERADAASRGDPVDADGRARECPEESDREQAMRAAQELGAELVSAARRGSIDEVSRVLAQIRELNQAYGGNMSSSSVRPLGASSSSALASSSSSNSLLHSALNYRTVGCTALHYAVFYSQPNNSHASIVRMLVECGADLNVVNHSGFTPLHWAVDKGQSNIVKFLLEWEVLPDKLADNGCTALHMAVQRYIKSHRTSGEPSACSCGAYAGSQASTVSEDAACADFQMIRCIVELGAADVNLGIGEERDMVASSGHQRLRSSGGAGSGGGGAQDAASLKTPLLLAAECGCVLLVQYFLRKGADPCKRMKGGHTALHKAVVKKKVDVVKELLKSEKDKTTLMMRAQDDKGRTPLHWAAFGMERDIVQLLVAGGAPLDVLDEKGYSPAAMVLLASGVDPKEGTEDASRLTELAASVLGLLQTQPGGHDR